MRTSQLLENLTFHETDAYAEPLFVDEHGRVLRFMLQPGQAIKQHNAPHSPFYAVVLKGEGMFAGADGKEMRFGPGALLIFDPGEMHKVRALDEELVFVGFLHGVPGTPPGKVLGEIPRHEA